MDAEKILEIADKNGFDFFGENKSNYVKTPISCSHIKFNEESWDEFRRYSLSDLATNKSFLEALAVEMLKRNEN